MRVYAEAMRAMVIQIEDLRAENAKLKALVQEGYFEGDEDGAHNQQFSWKPTTKEATWEESDTKRKLEGLG